MPAQRRVPHHGLNALACIDRKRRQCSQIHAQIDRVRVQGDFKTQRVWGAIQIEGFDDHGYGALAVGELGELGRLIADWLGWLSRRGLRRRCKGVGWRQRSWFDYRLVWRWERGRTTGCQEQSERKEK